MALLEPDRFFSRVTMIDVERDILALGFAHVLIDVDNTLLTRDTHEVPRDVGFWLAKARDAGIAFCLLSNNWHEGVHELAGRLELPIVSHAVKPLPPAFLIARNKIGGTRTSTLVIGDQLITDVLGAHFLGMKAYMVCPLVEQDLKHTLLLRNVERVILGNRKPEDAPAPAPAPVSFRSREADEDGMPGEGTLRDLDNQGNGSPSRPQRGGSRRAQEGDTSA